MPAFYGSQATHGSSDHTHERPLSVAVAVMLDRGYDGPVFHGGGALSTTVLSVIALVLAISILWPQWRGAMWLPTNRDMVRKMLMMAQVGPGDVVYDLGCGDGPVIIAAARHFGARAVGIEIEPLRFVWCQIVITILGLRSRVRVVYGNLFSQDLGAATVVTCYLLQRTNRMLQAKFRAELRPGTRIVSNYFTFPQFRLAEKDKADSLYLYIIE